MFVQIFQNRIQKRKNIVETEREYYLSVIFGNALEYFRILFFHHLHIEYYVYIDSYFVFSFVERRYLSVILWNNLD